MKLLFGGILLLWSAATAVNAHGDTHDTERHLRKRELGHDAIVWKSPINGEPEESEFIRSQDWWGQQQNTSDRHNNWEGRPHTEVPTEEPEEPTCGEPGLGMCPIDYHCECSCDEEHPTPSPATTTTTTTTTTTKHPPVETCESIGYPHIVDDECCESTARHWGHDPQLCCKCGPDKFKIVSKESDCKKCDDSTQTTTSTTSTTSTTTTSTQSSTTSTTTKPTTSTTTTTTTAKPATSTTTSTKPAATSTTTTTTTTTPKDDKCRDGDNIMGTLGGLCSLSGTPFSEAVGGIPFPCCVVHGVNSCITCDYCDALQLVTPGCCSEGEDGDRGCPDDRPYCCRTEAGFSCESSEDTCYEPSPPPDTCSFTDSDGKTVTVGLGESCASGRGLLPERTAQTCCHVEGADQPKCSLCSDCKVAQTVAEECCEEFEDDLGEILGADWDENDGLCCLCGKRDLEGGLFTRAESASACKECPTKECSEDKEICYISSYITGVCCQPRQGMPGMVAGDDSMESSSNACAPCSACQTDYSGAYPSACCNDDPTFGEVVGCGLGYKCCRSGGSGFSCMQECPKDTATEAPGTDPPKTDPPGTDPPKTDPPGTDPPKTDPPETDPPKTDPPKTDPPKTDPPKTDPPKTDPPITDPPSSTEEVDCSIDANIGKVCDVGENGKFKVCCDGSRRGNGVCIPCDECDQACCFKVTDPIVGEGIAGCGHAGFTCCPAKDGHICMLGGCPDY